MPAYAPPFSTAVVHTWTAKQTFGPITNDNAIVASNSLTGANVQPVLSLAATWNVGSATPTGLLFNLINTASGAASKFFDWQLGGTSVLALTATGAFTLTVPASNVTDPLLTMIWDGNTAPGIYPRGILGDSIDDTQHSFHIGARKARGTRASKAALQTGDYQAAFVSEGYDGSAYQVTGFLTWLTTATPTSGVRVPSKFALSTMGPGDTSSQFRMFVDERGLILGSPSAAAVSTIAAMGVVIGTTTAGSYSLMAENSGASGSSNGSFIGVSNNDGAALASGDRIGGLTFLGSSSAASVRTAAAIEAFASEAWSDGAAYGARLEVKTVTNGATSRTTKLILANGGLLAFGATLANTVPALKPSSTVMQARLGDDSAFAPLQGMLRTDTNATTGLAAGVLAALTNASIELYDASGQKYRVPVII